MRAAEAVLNPRKTPIHRPSGSMCECGRRTSSCVGLIPKVHGCDKTGIHGEYVENFAVR